MIPELSSLRTGIKSQIEQARKDAAQKLKEDLGERKEKVILSKLRKREEELRKREQELLKKLKKEKKQRKKLMPLKRLFQIKLSKSE